MFFIDRSYSHALHRQRLPIMFLIDRGNMMYNKWLNRSHLYEVAFSSCFRKFYFKTFKVHGTPDMMSLNLLQVFSSWELEMLGCKAHTNDTKQPTPFSGWTPKEKKKLQVSWSCGHDVSLNSFPVSLNCRRVFKFTSYVMKLQTQVSLNSQTSQNYVSFSP